ncbi:TIGR03086 family metal-binding protein [Streptacidiphilus jiangxiensis]|uniref:TIGR03086 family protein n=1 Tax=Streptacidiphilus jiangxiensis TaxID=235985 RepID=A0A1H7WY66_STRJI|nr:TIGR03086 family metal-binding protein [Streptacidiphilus jiangxiensis]SEM26556.1 TIGR03086 family protein [Streptacidiphilus jiangxiensis]
MMLAPLHSRALALMTPLVSSVRPEDLTRRTPCAAWDVHRLLSHVIGQQDGFAESAYGRGDVPGVFDDRPLPPGTDLSAAFLHSAKGLTEAFTEAEATGRTLAIPEILPGHGFPAAQAIGFHLLDTVVHAWDLAAALGQPFDCPEELLPTVVQVAEFVPTDPAYRGPGRAFAPVLPGAPEGGLDRALRLLGRDPDWHA